MNSIYNNSKVYNDSNSLDFYINCYPEIVKYKTKPFHMANESLDEYVFSKIRKEFPEARLISYNSSQWICLNKKHINYVKKQIMKRIEYHRLQILQLEKIISEVEVKNE